MAALRTELFLTNLLSRRRRRVSADHTSKGIIQTHLSFRQTQSSVRKSRLFLHHEIACRRMICTTAAFPRSFPNLPCLKTSPRLRARESLHILQVFEYELGLSQFPQYLFRLQTIMGVHRARQGFVKVAIGLLLISVQMSSAFVSSSTRLLPRRGTLRTMAPSRLHVAAQAPTTQIEPVGSLEDFERVLEASTKDNQVPREFIFPEYFQPRASSGGQFAEALVSGCDVTALALYKWMSPRVISNLRT